jgi:co-chaperonin GroES (HSP10)
MHVRPLVDWMVVHMEPLPEASAGGIVLVGSGVERQRTGAVLRVGPGRWLYKKGHQRQRKPMTVKVGDHVVFFRENLEHQQAKAILQHLEDDVGMIREDDVLFVVEP